MRKQILIYTLPALLIMAFTACLKSNPYFEDFSSTQPIADIPKGSNINVAAPALAVVLDSMPSTQTVDLKTAVHISAKDHIGDVTIKLNTDTVAAKALIARVPITGQTDYRTYKLMPLDLITIASQDVVIPNAGVFSTGDFVVQIKTGTMTKAAFNANKYLIAFSIVDAGQYVIASNFKTIYYRITVK